MSKIDFGKLKAAQIMKKMTEIFSADLYPSFLKNVLPDFLVERAFRINFPRYLSNLISNLTKFQGSFLEESNYFLSQCYLNEPVCIKSCASSILTLEPSLSWKSIFEKTLKIAAAKMQTSCRFGSRLENRIPPHARF